MYRFLARGRESREKDGNPLVFVIPALQLSKDKHFSTQLGLETLGPIPRGERKRRKAQFVI